MNTSLQPALKATPAPSPTSKRTGLMQRKCACGGAQGMTGDCEECENKKRLALHRYSAYRAAPATLLRSLAEHSHSGARAINPFPSSIHQAPGADPTTVTTEPAAGSPTTTVMAGLIVDDETHEVGSWQMRKSDFLAELRAAVSAAADAELARAGRSTEGCPYLERAFNHYQTQSGRWLERAIHRFAPEAAGGATAREYIPLLSARIRQAVIVWATTGRVAGVPEELASEFPSKGLLGTLGGLASGVGSLVGGASQALTGIGRVFFKERQGGTSADEVDTQTITSELGDGQSLESGVRAQMERAFGYDFSRVRIHRDGKAASLSTRLNARAFTIGADIAFAAGEYQPGTLIGDALLAHELAHVAQQGGVRSELQLEGQDDNAELEADADSAAIGAVSSIWFGTKAALGNITQRSMPQLRSGLRLQRCSECSKSERESIEVSAKTCCSEKMTQEIMNLRGRAIPLVRNALSRVSAPENVRTKLWEHFRIRPDDHEGRVGSVQTQFRNMLNTMENEQVKFYCRDSQDEPCKAFHRRAAAENCSSTRPPRMWLCGNYEGDRFLTGDNWLKSIIHEYVHAGCRSVGNILSEGQEYYRGITVYPPENPDLAIKNADSYAWFAMEAGQGDTPQTAVTPPNLAQLESMTAWQLAQLPDVALAQSPPGGATTEAPPNATSAQPPPGGATTEAPPNATSVQPQPGGATAGVPQMQDYARAQRVVRCIFDFQGITFDPETPGPLGREPNAQSEWPILRRTISQILAHGNVSGLVQGPGGRGEIGTPQLAGKIRIVDKLGWGTKRFHLENLVSPVGTGADPLVFGWWQEPRCQIQPGSSPNITKQERLIATLNEHIKGYSLGIGGFYFPPDDTIYLGEALMEKMVAGGSTGADAVLTAGHEMVHLLGGRESTRQAFKNHFQDETWICYWSAFEEGMAEITARDALKVGQSGGGREYQAFVDLMRPIMQELGPDRVRQAYFTGTPDADIFDRVQKGLPAHMDPTLPPVCKARLSASPSQPAGQQIQPKLIVSLPGDPYEQEADRIAERVKRASTLSTSEPEPLTTLSRPPALIQRAATDEAMSNPAVAPTPEPAPTAATPETATPEETAAPGLIVEDEARDIGPGQMRKSAFLDELRATICAVADAELAAVGRDTQGCPYIERWIDYYRTRDSQYVNRALRRYAPEGAAASSARDYISIVGERVRSAVAVWATTGQITGVPAELTSQESAVETTGEAGQVGGPFFKARAGGAEDADPQAIQAQLGPGQSLDGGVRSRMERVIGHDFSRVRVHADARAAELSAGLNARAFTVGRDIAFGDGEYRPGTLVGDAILAHELAHVAQQTGGSASLAPMKRADTEYHSLEEDADRSAFGAVISLWGNAKGRLAEIADRALPRFKSGLRVQRCDWLSGGTKEAEQKAAGTTGASSAATTPGDAGATAQPAPGVAETPGNAGATAQPAPTPAPGAAPCTGAIDADKVIVDHQVDPSPAVIEKPGDGVKFTVTFACKVKGDGFSKLIAPDGSEFSRKSFTKGQGQFTRDWDGKKPFPKVGTYLADDGDYHHTIEPVKYAIKGGKDLMTTGPKHDSPVVEVKARSHKGAGADHFHFTTANVDALAAIIESEIGVGNDTEKKAVAWCVRNQMIKLGTGKVEDARDHFKDAHDQAASASGKTIAEEILKKPMSDDITGGAIKWFSPRSMPKKGESCAGKDCKGGLITVTDEAGKTREVNAPGWHKTMSYVTVIGAREWYLRVYKL